MLLLHCNGKRQSNPSRTRYFFGFDVELPKSDFICASGSNMLNIRLKSDASLCIDRHSGNPPSLLDTDDVSSEFFSDTTCGCEQYSFHYRDARAQTVLEETPQVDLPNKALINFVSVNENTAQAKNKLSGWVDVRVLDAFRPRFRQLEFTDPDSKWSRVPSTYEVFYSYTDVSIPGLKVYHQMHRSVPKLANCTVMGADSDVQQVDSWIRPKQKHTALVVDFVCAGSFDSSSSNYVFQVQFVYSDRVWYTPPLPVVVDLTNGVYEHEFDHYSSDCQLNDTKLTRFVKITEEGVYKIICSSKIIQTIYALRFTKFRIKEFETLRYVTRSTPIELSLNHPHWNRELESLVKNWQCYRLHPIANEPISQLKPEPGYNKVACFFALSKHLHVVTDQLIYFDGNHEDMIYLTGFEKYDALTFGPSTEAFVVQAYFGTQALSDSQLVTCQGLSPNNQYSEFDDFNRMGVKKVICSIPAKEQLFKKVLYFNKQASERKKALVVEPTRLSPIPWSLIITPNRTATCVGETLTFSCHASQVTSLDQFEMFITHGTLGIVRTGNSIEYTVKNSTEDIVVECKILEHNELKHRVQVKVIDDLRITFGIIPEGIEYYVDGIESVLRVTLDPPELLDDPKLKWNITANPGLIRCTTPMNPSPSAIISKAQCRELTIYMTLDKCPQKTENFQLYDYGELFLEVTPQDRRFVFNQPEPRTLYTCELNKEAPVLATLLNMSWEIPPKMQQLFYVEHQTLRTTKNSSSGKYCIYCKLKHGKTISKETCFTVFYRSHFHLWIEMEPNEQIITLDTHGNWKCRVKYDAAILFGMKSIKDPKISIQPQDSSFQLTGDTELRKEQNASDENKFQIRCLLLFESTEIKAIRANLLMIDETKMELIMDEKTVYNVSIRRPLTCIWKSPVLQREIRFRPVIYLHDEPVGHEVYLTRAGRYNYRCEAEVNNIKRVIHRNITVLPGPNLSLQAEPPIICAAVITDIPDITCKVVEAEWQFLKPVWYPIRPEKNAILKSNQLLHDKSLKVSEGQYTYVCVLDADFGRYSYILFMTRFEPRLKLWLIPSTRSIERLVWYRCVSNSAPREISITEIVLIKGLKSNVDYDKENSAMRFRDSTTTEEEVAIRCVAKQVYMGVELESKFIDVHGVSYKPNFLLFYPEKSTYVHGESIECRSVGFSMENFLLHIIVRSWPPYSETYDVGSSSLFFREEMLGGPYGLMCVMIVNNSRVATSHKNVHLEAPPTRLLLSKYKIELPGRIRCLTNGFIVKMQNISWHIVSGPSDFVRTTTEHALWLSALNLFGDYQIQCTYSGLHDGAPFKLQQTFTVSAYGTGFSTCKTLSVSDVQLPWLMIVLLMLSWTMAILLSSFVFVYLFCIARPSTEELPSEFKIPKRYKSLYVYIREDELSRSSMLKLLYLCVLFDHWQEFQRNLRWMLLTAGPNSSIWYEGWKRMMNSKMTDVNLQQMMHRTGSSARGNRKRRPPPAHRHRI